MMTEPGPPLDRRTSLETGAIRDVPDLPPRSSAVAYAIAVALTLAALLLTVLFKPYLERSVFLMFWPAVFASAWIGGLGPALLAAVLAVAVVDYALIPPALAFKVTSARDAVNMLGFLAVAGVTAWGVAQGRLIRVRAEEAALENARLARQLDAQGQELIEQLEEAQAMSEELEASTEELAERTSQAESAERFSRGVLESIVDPFVVYDTEWRFQYANEAARRIISADPDAPADVMGKIIWDIWPRVKGSPLEENMRRALDRRMAVTFQSFIAADGTWSEIHCYPLPDGGLGVQWKNITEQKRAEESAHYLARATELLARSLDHEKTLEELAHLIVPHFADWCAVSILDEKGAPRQLAVAHVDPEKVNWAREINGRYPPDPSATTGVPQVIRTGKPELYPDIPDELLVAAAIDEEHLRLTREVGLRSAIVVPLSTSERTFGAITIVSAESGRRYSESDLAFAMELARRAALAVDNAIHHEAELTARRAAETANAAKTQFLAVMSHELRTPLNAIGGYTELLLMGLRGPLTPDQQADLDRIQRSQRNLLSLINDILNYAKLDAGRVEYSMSAVALHPVLMELEPLVTPQLRARKLSYEYTGCDPTLTAWADPEKVRQVLLNLLSNAIKFTEAGGKISIECSSDDEHARVIVRDTGLGIPADKLATIFEPFVQLERKLSSTHEGTGLGLAISRDLARGMGGELTVESKLGDGSTFVLSLRRQNAAVLDAVRA